MKTPPRTIVAAIRALGSHRAPDRVRARKELETIGTEATWALVQAVQPAGPRSRQEALQVLVTLADPAAADLFLELLDDQDSEVRWLAAEGLAALGELGLRRTLQRLVDDEGTDAPLRPLHHVLTLLEDGPLAAVVAPVLQAFREPSALLRIQTAAHAALAELRRAPSTLGSVPRN